MGETMCLDPNSLVLLLNDLEAAGLAFRRRDPADRRRHIVELTAAGSGEVAQTFSQLRVVEDQLFKALTAAERTTLYGMLSRAVEALAPACEPAGCAASEPDDCLGPESGASG
jgi:DNA-binding MarR family transcriptional regulator